MTKILLHEEVGTGHKTFATVTKVSNPIGSVQLEISSTFAKAKNPLEEQVRHKIFLNSAVEVTKLVELLQSAI